jgi:acetylglutamate kinase
VSIVIKLGGNMVEGQALRTVAADVAALAREGARIVLVHGGGPQTTAMQERLGMTAEKVGGRRVTDAETLEVLKMVVGGRLNIDLCAALLHAGAQPIGLHGGSSCAIEAVRRPPQVIFGGPAEPVDLGFVGDIVAINRPLFERLLDAGHTPVVACIGANHEGELFNINADRVANRLAVELGAEALVFASRDVPGVLADKDDPSTRIAKITEPKSRELVEQGVIVEGMIPKVEESFAAIRAGVHRVHIVGALSEGDLARELASPGATGTALVS